MKKKKIVHRKKDSANQKAVLALDEARELLARAEVARKNFGQVIVQEAIPPSEDISWKKWLAGAAGLAIVAVGTGIATSMIRSEEMNADVKWGDAGFSCGTKRKGAA